MARPERERRLIALYRAAIEGDEAPELSPPLSKYERELFIKMRDRIKQDKAEGKNYIYEMPFD